MENKRIVPPEVEVIRFSESDVISASGVSGGTGGGSSDSAGGWSPPA